MSDERKPAEYVIVILLLNIIIAVFCVYLANFIFVQWQKVPMEYFSYHTLNDYYAVYGSSDAVLKAIKGSVGVGSLVFVGLNVGLLIMLFSKPQREQYGSARFATRVDIVKTGLLPTPKQQKDNYAKKPSKPSILVGKYKDKFLEFFGNEFVFIAAPTRSGKGVGIVIPNLLHYRDSVVVLDVKNENWDLTAGFRSKYQDVYLFAPSAIDNKSHCYNPFDYIDRRHTKRMGDIQNIGNILYPATGDDAFWADQAKFLFTGLVLYMMETPSRPCTLSEMFKLSTPMQPLEDWIAEIIKIRQTKPISVFYDKDGNEMGYSDSHAGQTQKQEIRPLTSECVENLMIFASNSDKTRSSILSTFQAPLEVFKDPMVACATSRSDFRLDEVRKKKMSIYVGIQPNELPRFGKLLNLFFSQLINLNTKVLPEQDSTLKYQCLVLLDEFTALGYVEIINKAVAYIAGYNIRLMLIFQNKGQAEQYYGREGTQTLLSNMACQIVFAPRDQADAEEYSKLLGTQTIKGRSVSRNRGKGGGGSVSISDQQRSLMLPQEMREMDKGKEIILFDAYKPIMADKILYYQEPTFLSRLSKEKTATGQQKGLPIPKDRQPQTLNVEAMLEVMRSSGNKPLDFSELMQAEDMVNDKKHQAFFEAFNKTMGFEADFIKHAQEIHEKRMNNNG